SGAIVVGASGGAGSNAPACYTNHGDRVDAYAWGGGVATLGYGDLKANGADQRQWYTGSFGGTSSASPIVAGSVALIQAIRKSRGMPVLTPAAMRSLLRPTGTPQSP